MRSNKKTKKVIAILWAIIIVVFLVIFFVPTTEQSELSYYKVKSEKNTGWHIYKHIEINDTMQIRDLIRYLNKHSYNSDSSYIDYVFTDKSNDTVAWYKKNPKNGYEELSTDFPRE